jgi:hypothetical protein
MNMEITLTAAQGAAFAWIAAQTKQTAEAVAQQAVDAAAIEWAKQMNAASEQTWIAKRAIYDAAKPTDTKATIEAAATAAAIIVEPETLIKEPA